MWFRNALCTAVVLFPAFAAAQTPPSDQLKALLAEQLQPLHTQMEQLTGVAQQVVANKDQIEQNRQALVDQAANLTQALDLIRELQAKVDDLNTNLGEQVERQRQILDAIATQDSTGRHVPRISANMAQSAEFRDEISQAVHDSIRKSGTFQIHNRTDSYQRIYVNRKEYGINAGKSLRLDETPVGTVTTQLPGQRLENWTLAAPNYEESIEIIPPENTANTVYRPLAAADDVSSATTVYQPLTTVYQPLTTVYRPLTTTYSVPSTTTTVLRPMTTTVYSLPTTVYNPAAYYWPSSYYYWPY